MNKEFWERKQRNIDIRNEENREILENYFNDAYRAEEVSNIIDTITKMRHEIHSTDALFNSESANYQEQVDFIENIDYELQKLDLEKIGIPYDIEEMTSDFEVYEMGMDYDDALDSFYKEKEKINKTIEDWLKKFDEKYGTHYAPTGTDRRLKF